MEERGLYDVRDVRGTSKIKKISKKIWTTILIICFVFNNLGMVKVSQADSTTWVSCSINYIEETVTIAPGSNTRFYVSLDNKKTWELMDSNVLDISSLLSTKEVIIYFKGNKDTKEAEVKLPAEDKTLTVAYKISAGVGRIEFTSAQAVEYRKGANGAWRTATSLMPTLPYEIKGTTLYFRTVATADRRAGKPVTVKIPKRPTAPSVKLDGSKLFISGVKSGETYYRVGTNDVWALYTATSTTAKTIDLSAMLGGSTSGNTPIPAGVIEFRTLGTDKKTNSAVKVIEVPLQRTITSAIASVSGSTLTILDSVTTNLYEFTTVSGTSQFNILTAKWSPATYNKPVLVKNVAINDRILVRQKSVTDKETKQIIPASIYVSYSVSSISSK